MDFRSANHRKHRCIGGAVMAYFSLGQLLANIDETKKAFNQANYVLSESGLWIPVRASNAGEVFAQLTGSNTADVTFHDAATVAANGTVLTVNGYKTLTVEIYGTSTSRTVAFKGRGPSGEDRSLMGVNLSDFSTATSTTGTGELWQFDITGLTSVFMDLTSVSGGNVSIKGKVVV